MANVTVIIPGLLQLNKAHWKCPVASVYINDDDYWWRMTVLEGWSVSKGEISTTTPLKNKGWGYKLVMRLGLGGWNDATHGAEQKICVSDWRWDQELDLVLQVNYQTQRWAIHVRGFHGSASKNNGKRLNCNRSILLFSMHTYKRSHTWNLTSHSQARIWPLVDQ